MTARTFGWVQPALPQRRRSYAAATPGGGWAPHTDIDLRPLCPDVRDQSYEGACVGFATTTAALFAILRAQRDNLWQGVAEVLSPQWTYWRTRANFGMTGQDSGCSIHDALRMARTAGLAPERLYPYDPSAFAATPPPAVAQAASGLVIVNSEQLSADADTLLATLAMGFPLVFGITVYPSFEQSRDGRIVLPRDNEEARGGHALVGVGAYVENGERRIRFQNSWGTGWGDAGYGSLPVNYLVNPGLCGEVHALRVVGRAAQRLGA